MSVEPSFWELARQALSNTDKGYDLLAPKFEATAYATPTDWIEVSLKRAQDHFPAPKAGTRGADLACGTGRASRALCSYCESVDGFDFSAKMLEVAETMSPSLPCRWQRVDLAELDLSSRTYHRVVTFGAWGHILAPFRRRLLRQTLDSLVPGGLFLTLTADEPAWYQKRFWFQLGFDLGIKLRNRIWFGNFHMYYRLNNTSALTHLLREIAGDEFLVIVDKPPELPSAVSLLMVSRKSSR